MDFGEIMVKFSRELSSSLGWMSTGLAGAEQWHFYHPEFEGDPDGWHAVGSLMALPDADPDSDHVVLVVKADADADPSAPPRVYPGDYVFDIWLDMEHMHVPPTDIDVSFWWPSPPAGYAALGVLARHGRDNTPVGNETVCLRDDLVFIGDLDGSGVSPWSTQFFSDDEFHAFHEIVPIAAPASEKLYLPASTFSYTDSEHGEHHPVVEVLNLTPPLVSESEAQVIVPRLTDFQTPPEQTLPLMLRTILIPFTHVTDPEYAGREDWQLDNSPFYRLERDVYYKLRYFNYNQTSAVQENRLEIVSGVNTAQSEQFWEESGVSVSRETGVMIGSETYGGTISDRTSTNVSRSIGFATMTNIQEFYEEHTTTTVYTPPGKAAAMWQKYNRITLKRHVGTTLEIVAIYETGVNEFVTDDYPDGGD